MGVLFCFLLLYPISSRIATGVQTLDIFLTLIVVVYSFTNIQLSNNFILFILLFFLLVSFNVIFIQIFGFSVKIEGFFLFSKILIIMFAFIVMKNIFQNLKYHQLEKVFYLFLFVTGALCIWCIVQFSLAPLSRVGFPYSSVEDVDSHVLGSLLSLLFIYFAMALERQSGCKNILISFCLMVIFGAIFTTGSRSVVLVFLLWSLFVTLRMTLQGKWQNLSVLFLVVGVISILFVGGAFEYNFSDLRSLQFSLQSPSEAKRIDRLLNVFTGLDQSFYFVGRGLFAAEIYYFDGVITFLLYNFGVVGVLCFVIAICYNVKNYLIKGYQHSLFAALAMSAVVVSEFFLLSRWIVPVFICYFLLYEQIRYSHEKCFGKHS
ncbi:hypothetical protein UF64_00305 [Thalassospira sp. HJ]|nr:hypothetical protein UF64_00305 [Thalassospira sp. HJ]